MYPEVMKAVVHLLDPRNLSLVEAAFVCLGFLFKFLLKQMLSDVQNVFRCACGMLHPLLCFGR